MRRLPRRAELRRRALRRGRDRGARPRRRRPARRRPGLGRALRLPPRGPPHALAAGADAFVASSHKTLAAFTQSAFLLARGGFLDLERLDESFELLHTTSLSAALLASLDRARMIMATRGEELLGETLRLAAVRPRAPGRGGGPRRRRLRRPDEARARASRHGRGRARGGGRPLRAGHPLRARQPRPARPAPDDRGHRGGGRAPLRRAGRLARAAPGRAASARRRERGLGRHARDGHDARGRRSSPRGRPCRPRTPPAASPPRWSAPYPPGIPAIAPGEVVSRELVEALRQAAAAGTRLAYCADPALGTLQVVARALSRRSAICYKEA